MRIFTQQFNPNLICSNGSDAQSNVAQGRIISQLVSLFDSVDEMVEENDRRHLEREDEINENQTKLEYVFFLSPSCDSHP